MHMQRALSRGATRRFLLRYKRDEAAEEVRSKTFFGEKMTDFLARAAPAFSASERLLGYVICNTPRAAEFRKNFLYLYKRGRGSVGLYGFPPLGRAMPPTSLLRKCELAPRYGRLVVS